MPTPTFFIGVGGTGLNVVHRIGRLMNAEIQKAEDDLNFQDNYYLFVQDSDQDSFEGSQIQNDFREFSISVTEKYPDTTDGDDLVKEYQEQYSQFTDWWSDQWTPVGSIGGDGVGNDRRKGRLYFMYSFNNENIFRKVQGVLENIQQRQGINRVNVVIVGSSYGGTGSSNLVDMAYYLRNLFDRSEINNTGIFGVTFTPFVFTSEPTNQENSIPSLQELNFWQWSGGKGRHLLNSASEVDGFPYQFTTGTGEKYEFEKRPFDTVMVVSGLDRNDKRIATEAGPYHEFAARSLYHLFCDPEIANQANASITQLLGNIKQINKVARSGFDRSKKCVYPGTFGALGYAQLEYERDRVIQYFIRRKIAPFLRDIAEARNSEQIDLLTEDPDLVPLKVKDENDELVFRDMRPSGSARVEYENLEVCNRGELVASVKEDLNSIEHSLTEAWLDQEHREAQLEAEIEELERIVKDVRNRPRVSFGTYVGFIEQLLKKLKAFEVELNKKLGKYTNQYEEKKEEIKRLASMKQDESYFMGIGTPKLSDEERNTLRSHLDSALGARKNQVYYRFQKKICDQLLYRLNEIQERESKYVEFVTDICSAIEDDLAIESLFEQRFPSVKTDFILSSKELLREWYQEIKDEGHLDDLDREIKDIIGTYRKEMREATRTKSRKRELKESFQDELLEAGRSYVETEEGQSRIDVPKNVWGAIKKEAELKGENDWEQYVEGKINNFLDSSVYQWSSRGGAYKPADKLRNLNRTWVEHAFLGYNEKSWEDFQDKHNPNYLRIEDKFNRFNSVGYSDPGSLLLVKMRSALTLWQNKEIGTLYNSTKKMVEELGGDDYLFYTDKRFYNQNLPVFERPISGDDSAHIVFLLGEFMGEIWSDISSGTYRKGKKNGNKIVDERGRENVKEKFSNSTYYEGIKKEVIDTWNNEWKGDRPEKLKEVQEDLERRNRNRDLLDDDIEFIEDILNRGEAVLRNNFEDAFGTGTS